VQYIPPQGFVGADTFNYTFDGLWTGTATFNVVSPIADSVFDYPPISRALIYPKYDWLIEGTYTGQNGSTLIVSHPQIDGKFPVEFKPVGSLNDSFSIE